MKIGVGISEDIGSRKSMEDEYAIYDRPANAFFSAEVYDGHAGREPARLASEMLTPHFLDAWSIEAGKPPAERRAEEELVREAYIATDEYIAFKQVTGGAAALTLYLIEDRFIAANAGDSRAIIGTEAGVQPLTLDHRPGAPEEKARIESLGGMVTLFGTPRVMGFLAVSRALGDSDMKPYVTAEPRIATGLLGRENDFAVLACDGVWDILSSETVIAIARAASNPQEGAGSDKEQGSGGGRH